VEKQRASVRRFETCRAHLAAHLTTPGLAGTSRVKTILSRLDTNKAGTRVMRGQSEMKYSCDAFPSGKTSRKKERRKRDYREIKETKDKRE
jgi:hypothetical protein